MPDDGKVCTFDCLYCECGFNADRRAKSPLPTREEVADALEKKLKEMISEDTQPDVLTFAGNGEPTVHPQFNDIIDDTIALRNRYCPKAKVSVLTNATLITKEKVFEALCKVDNNILKLDSAIDATARTMNRPQCNYCVEDIVQAMQSFDGEFILQTMFLRGECEGIQFDNTTDEEVEAWLRIVERLRPRQVMVYSIARDTPCKTLQKVTTEELSAIAEKVRKLGIECSVA